ncbi:1,4-dihydroxy-2-naphthoate octaprenyltransferase [uncultured Proteiniphilum sp.]|uniref:1,4-dihydroxy-2-naphthoate octaprenyltransferase n=1 Tax=uncultured Proteiniphilum sp. TaxID=497637 RepID=UPI0026201F71|nr:1,4-dihydroxy-2-naphthoate octaprenyltransferase [uncultured Proteiniphilum sp.]
MATVKDWISAFRLRTLFLAVGTVVLGSGLALHEGSFSMTTFVLTFLLAVSIQILANLANDLGDFQKGTDITGRRQGPARTLQSGKISPREMKGAITLFSTICIITGLSLVFNITDYIPRSSVALLIGLGGASILAALLYTLGKHAYGYKGWGDLFAFIFFGPVPVIGTYFLHTHVFNFQPVLPAIGIGLISTMILNINNMRDIENDRDSGKITLAVKLGIHRAKIYHAGLTFTSFLCFLGYNSLYAPLPWYRHLYLLVFLFLFRILANVYRKNGQALDPYLKLTSLSGFLLALLFSVGVNI